MSKTFSVGLKAGERVFINGAVLRVDRKVTIEFLNEVAFLLEQHVMDVEQTTTPCRQLYFIVQTMLIDPANVDATRTIFETSYERLSAAVETQALKAGLLEVHKQVENKRYFDALKTLRGLFPIEDGILAADIPTPASRKISAPIAQSSTREITLCR